MALSSGMVTAVGGLLSSRTERTGFGRTWSIASRLPSLEKFFAMNFIQWFSANAFGGTNYSNTPIGAVSHTEEPQLFGVENSATYFGLWASGKNFAISAWNSRNTSYFQAVGDPFVVK